MDYLESMIIIRYLLQIRKYYRNFAANHGNGKSQALPSHGQTKPNHKN